MSGEYGGWGNIPQSSLSRYVFTTSQGSFQCLSVSTGTAPNVLVFEWHPSPLNAWKLLRHQHWVHEPLFQPLHTGLGREKPLFLSPQIFLAAQGALCPRGRNLHFWIVETNFQQFERLEYGYRMPIQAIDDIRLLISLNECRKE